MRNILIPTDFSENSWNALTYGLEFFKDVYCNFYLLNVTTITNYSSDFPILSNTEVIEKTQLEQAKKSLKLLQKRINSLQNNYKHNFNSTAVFDFFIEAVSNEIIDKNIDLIIMGTKGATGLEEVIIGSNTGDVITKVNCPVLVVPEKAKYQTPSEIALPTDYNIFYNPKILLTISEITSIHNSTLRILNVAKKDEILGDYQVENKEFLTNFFSNEKHSFHQVTNNSIEAGIQCFIESRDINMLLMVTKNHNLFQKIFFTPTVEEISYHVKVPMLVLHE